MILAYYALHYGSDYLGYSIKSIYKHVDKICILYSATPSHGHTTDLKNPDSKEKLQAASKLFGDPDNKIMWVDGNWQYEGQHRDHSIKIAQQVGADMILVVDADEIWQEDVLLNFIKRMREGTARDYCIRMLTPWRSFNWVCRDEMMPVRGRKPAIPSGVQYAEGSVLHFGYARSVPEIRYKLSCHGHKNEMRGNWLESKYAGWPGCGNKDLHPTCVNTWNAEPFDKNVMPEFMRSHPYWDREVI